jgi:hypothetical protein
MDGDKNINRKLSIDYRMVVVFLAMFSLLGENLISIENNRIFRNLGKNINSKYDEFMPAVFNDTLYFKRENKKGKIENHRLPFDKYLSSDPKTSLFNPASLNENINRKMAIDKKTYIDPSRFSFYNFTDSIHIWESAKSFFNKNDGEYNDLHPAMAPDGSFIIFASDRPAEQGAEKSNNTDLFISYRLKTGAWSEPKNLGKRINTNQNEITPYIDKDFNLYFASKGYRDKSSEIYYSDLKDDFQEIKIIESGYNYDILWVKPTIVGGKVKYNNKPEKLKYPFNTEWDDIGPTMYRDSLIISSNRPSAPQWGIAYGGFDLYAWTDPIISNDKQAKNIVLWGKIKGEAFKANKEVKIKIFGLDELGKNSLVVDTIIGAEGAYKYEAKRYCSYLYEVSGGCTESPEMKYDTLGISSGIRIDSSLKLRNDFSFNQKCKIKTITDCPLCDARLFDYNLDIAVKISADSFAAPVKLIVEQNGFPKYKSYIQANKKYKVALSQDDKRSDDIKIIIKSEDALFADEEIIKRIAHAGNPDSVDNIKVNIDIPENWSETPQKFVLKGKIVCDNAQLDKTGEIQISAKSNSQIFKTETDKNGKFLIELAQKEKNENFKIMYKASNSPIIMNWSIKHKISSGDLSDLKFKLSDELCGVCDKSITFSGGVQTLEYLCSLKGEIVFENLDNKTVVNTPVTPEGTFSIKLPYASQYKATYKSQCYSSVPSKMITMKKCPSDDIDIRLLFKIENSKLEFDKLNSEYPLFVKGYWNLNTRKNLSELIKNLKNKAFKTDVCCVINPTNMNSYDYLDYADSSYNLIKNAKEYILNILKLSECACLDVFNTGEKIELEICAAVGSDEINCDCKYRGSNIDELGLTINDGDNLDTETLGKLRAHSIYNEIISLFKSAQRQPELESKITFKLTYQAIDNSKFQGFSIKLIENTPIAKQKENDNSREIGTLKSRMKRAESYGRNK